MTQLSPVVARADSSTSASQHAVLADQIGSSGIGSAILAESTNPQVPAVVIRGVGTLLELRDGSGSPVASIGQDGTLDTSGGISGEVSADGDLTVTDGDVVIDSAGGGLRVKEGSNATMGTLALNGATPVVVATSAVKANSRIFLTHNTPGGTPAFAWVSARSAGVSFSVTGTALDTSTVAWLIINPAT